MIINSPVIDYINPTQYLFDVLEWQEKNGRMIWEDDDVRVQKVDDSAKHEEVKEITSPYMPEEWELNYIAKTVYAENQTETDESCRAVIDAIINRVRHEDFPDTYYGVITQKYQFSTWTYGFVQAAPVTDRMLRLVREELENQTWPYDIVYFTAGYYNPYCVPMFNLGNVYFGSQREI